MVVWFVALANGVPVHVWGGACLEPNLEFELVAASAESVTLRASFILEHGIWYPADGSAGIPRYGASVDLELARADLRHVAQELAQELQRYPLRAPEDPEPSPLL
jgi:hypothetical protein